MPGSTAGLEGRALLSSVVVTRPEVAIRSEGLHSRADRGGRVERNILYRHVPGDRERLDVFVPAGPAPAAGRPVIVAIHGGGWRKYSKEQYEPTAAPLARLGYVVVVPNYRLSSPRSPSWPVNFEAVRDSVRWVRSHAAQLGADPNRIAAMGESAGGHLAALLGTYPDGPVNPDGPAPAASPGDGVSARVQAVVDFYGPTDLASLEARNGGASGPIRQFLGATPDQAPGRYASASPLDHVSADDPPFLIFQGSKDWLVHDTQSIQLADRLSSVGVPNRLDVIPGAGHGFGLSVGGRDLVPEIDAFLMSSMP